MLRNELQNHLTLLKRNGLIETWHDRRITGGEEVDPIILAKLEEASVVLLLVSSDFINSDYCWGIEVRRAMERHEAGEAVVIPVILRPCLWQEAPFGKLLAAPTDSKPVTKWPDRDEAFLDVARIIQAAVERLAGKGDRKPPCSPVRPEPTAAVPRAGQVRSSNLAITKAFTQADKDGFLHDAFDYVANFFDGSLQALAERNSEITVRFRRIDADRFTAAAYRDGRKEAQCTVWTGGETFRSGINYRGDDSGATNGLNDSLSVETDENALHLKSWMHGGRDRKLTMEGGAEHFWENFLGPLQRRFK